nr:RNA-directed DNA polymerase, eukaryota, reverse transcriptase zinc-binding domain protein [Tanacetum cinerariifolium]
MLKKHRRQLAIKGILNNGAWIEDLDCVKAVFKDHFSKRFQKDYAPHHPFDIDMPKQLSSDQRAFLDRDISREEIKKAVWDCGGDPAPGPDGFTFKFFTTFWDLLESDMTRFVHAFFLDRSFPKGCNSSFIALIPKVSNATLVTDFRPISLIGCQYKIIGKILANRLGLVISSCISPKQSAFIKGRNILDGPLILNKVMNWYRKRKEKLMIFNVDFKKAFDSLRWNFLDTIMGKLGFSSRWRVWIKGCFVNARSSIRVNGSLTTEFFVSKGSRQGDPLSPFLFILAMEGLHAFVCKAINVGIFKGASVGLRINVHKCSLLGACVSEEEVLDMASIIGCGAANFPLTYLGVPVGCRLTLLKSVLGNLPTYFMSLYHMFVSIRSKLESFRSNFFIGSDLGERKMAWVSWKTCLASKEMGGLGIGSIHALNVGLLSKWIWRFLHNHSDLWIHVIKGIYARTGGVSDLRVHGSSQSPWRGILSMVKSINLKGVDLLSLCRRNLGNGKTVSFWDDCWCGDQSLKNLRLLIEPVVLNSHQDTCTWSLGILKGYTVASVRSLIDLHFLGANLNATRWNRSIHVKVNLFMWRAMLNKLPTIVNLDRKGIEVDSLLCPICHEDVETVNCIFFMCDLSKVLWALLAKWWELDVLFCASISDWLSWLDSSSISSKARVFLDGVGAALMWSLWSFRNRLLFSTPPPKKSLIWDSIVSYSFLWISSINPKTKFSWVGWFRNPLLFIVSL